MWALCVRVFPSCQCLARAPTLASFRVLAMPDAEVTAPRGGAPQPAHGAAGARRFARDGNAYTWEEFVEFYGLRG